MQPDLIKCLKDLSRSEPAEQAKSFPSFAYQSSEMDVIDRSVVLQPSWQLAAHLSQLQKPGDHVVHQLADQPILVVNTGDGIQAYYNVCRHRAGPLALKNGHAKTLMCKYHGWNYHLDGRLKSAPEMQTTQGFDVSQYRLPKIKTEIWQGLVFVALNDDVPPLSALTTGIAAQVLPIDLATMSFHRRDEFVLQCNWKIYVENYLEGYHLPHVHPGLNQLLDYKSYRTELGQWHSYQYSPLEQSSGFYGEGQAHYYFLYPNTMLNILPNRLQTNQVLPLSNNQCRVVFDYYYPDIPEIDQLIAQDQQFSDEIQDEDVGICEAVQLGMNSGSYQPGPLCHKREAGVHHFQELLRQAYRQASTTGY